MALRDDELKVLGSIGLYLLATTSLTFAATLGWMIPYVARHGVEHVAFWLDKVPVLAAMGAAPISIVFLVAVRKRKQMSKIAALLVTSGILCMALAVAIPLAALYPGHAQYGFLRSRPVLYSLNPGMPGFLWDVYSFQGDFDSAKAEVRKELEPLGYQVTTNKRSPTVTFTLPGHSPDDLFKAVVSISPGKVTGHHFEIDGDFTEQNEDPGWVTIDVQRPDPMSMMLRHYVK